MKYTVIAKIVYGCVIGAGTLFLCFMHEGIVSAQELFSDKSEEMVIIADISLRDGEVTQDASGNFTLSFTAKNNGALAQPGIRYGVQLYRVSVHDTQQLVLADEFVFDETIVLDAGEEVMKEVSYRPPAGVSGVFEVRIVLKTKNGFPLGMMRLDPVRISGNLGVSVDTARCVLAKKGEKETHLLSIGTIVVNPEDNITMTCSVSNNDSNRSVIPEYTVFAHSVYGDEVLTKQGALHDISHGVSEMIFSIPMMQDAGEYQVRIALLERGQEVSAPVSLSYRIHGDPFFVANVLMDTSDYEKGDIASITYTLIPRHTIDVSSGNVSVGAAVYDSSGTVCGTSDLHEISADDVRRVYQGRADILLERSCPNARAHIVAYDELGQEIDTLYSDIVSEKERGLWLILLFGGVVFWGVYRMITRKTCVSRGVVSIFLGILLGVSVMMTSTSFAHALSFSVSGGDIYGTVNLSGDTFVAGSNIEIDAWMYAELTSSALYPAGIRWEVEDAPSPGVYEEAGFSDTLFATPPCTTEGYWWGPVTRTCSSDNTSGDVPPFIYNTALSDTITAPVYNDTYDIYFDVPVIEESFLGYMTYALNVLPATLSFSVTGGALPPPTIDLSVPDIYITKGTATDISWTVEHVVADSCIASGGWSGTRADVGTESTGYLNEDTTFTLTCDGTDGSTAVESVTVFALSQCEDGVDNDGDVMIDVWDDDCDLVNPELDNDEFGGPAMVDLVVNDTTNVPYGGSVDVWWSPENAETCTATSEYADTTSGPWLGDKTPEEKTACGSGWFVFNGDLGDNHGTTYFRKTYPEKVAYIPGDVIELALGFEDNPDDSSTYEVYVYWGVDESTPDTLVESPMDPSYTFASSDGAVQTAVVEVPVPDILGYHTIDVRIQSTLSGIYSIDFEVVDPSELGGCLGDHVDVVSGLTQDITFSITCEGPQGVDTDTVFVDVLSQPDYGLWGGDAEIINPAVSDTVSVGVTPLYGYTDTVTLSLTIDSNLPDGIDVYLDDTVLSSGEFGSGTTLHVDITDTIEESGIYTITVSGTDGSLVRTYDVLVQLDGFTPPEEYPDGFDYSEI